MDKCDICGGVAIPRSTDATGRVHFECLECLIIWPRVRGSANRRISPLNFSVMSKAYSGDPAVTTRPPMNVGLV